MDKKHLAIYHFAPIADIDIAEFVAINNINLVETKMFYNGDTTFSKCCFILKEHKQINDVFEHHYELVN